MSYYEPRICSKCESPCCEIYGEWYNPNGWFEDWCIEFHDNVFDTDEEYESHCLELYGVKPYFNPRVTWKTGNEHIIEKLKQKGIDHNFCEFYNKKIGCIIEYNKRPPICKTFRCNEWDEKLKNILGKNNENI